MSQVFNNLFINAKEAMAEGGRITVRGKNITVDGDEGLPLTEGKGTTFSVYLPASERFLNEIVLTEKKNEMNQQQAVPQRRVLLMDDDDRLLHVAGDMIRHLGYEVEKARNGEEAIDLYRRAKESGSRYDAVIRDLTVQGGLGGEKTLLKLLEIDPEVKGIISSGYADNPIMKDFKAYGFIDAIAKPYGIDKLKELVTNTFLP